VLPNRSRAAGLRPVPPFTLGFPDCFCSGGLVGGRRLAARGLLGGGSCRSQGSYFRGVTVFSDLGAVQPL